MGETRRKRHTHRHNNYKQNGEGTEVSRMGKTRNKNTPTNITIITEWGKHERKDTHKHNNYNRMGKTRERKHTHKRNNCKQKIEKLDENYQEATDLKYKRIKLIRSFLSASAASYQFTAFNFSQLWRLSQGQKMVNLLELTNELGFLTTLKAFP